MILLIPPGLSFWQAIQRGYLEPLNSPPYLAWVAELPCCVSSRKPVTVHHIVGHGLKAVGGKVSDFLTIPLAPELHLPDYPGGLHRLGHKAWEERHGSQLDFVARTLLQAVYEGVLFTRP